MAVSFELSLVDAVTAPARAAGASLGSITQQAKVLRSSMISLEKQATKAKALGDTDKLAEISSKYQAFGGALNEIKPQAAAASDGLGSLAGASVEAAGVLVGVAAAAAAVVGAVGAVVYAGAKFALEMTEMREKTLATFSALSGGREAGEATIKMLDDLRASTGLTRAELTPFATQLQGLGIQGAALKTQLTALASVKAVGIDGGTEEYLSILKKLSGQSKVSSKDLTNLYKTGVNVNEISSAMGVSVKRLQVGLKSGTIGAKAFGENLTRAVTKRGLGPLANQASTVGAQFALLKENFAQLFEGVDAQPFLDGLKDVLSIFGQNTASTQVFKTAITGTFNQLFKAAAKALPYIKVQFELLIIAGLKAYIAIKKFFSGEQGAARLAVVMGVLRAAVGVVANGFSLLVALGSNAVNVFVKISAAVIDVLAWLHKFAPAAYDTATSFVDGLLKGLAAGPGKIKAAVQNLGHSLLDGVRGVLGIHSPSIEMAKVGGHAVTGLVQGVQASNDKVATVGSGLGASLLGGTEKGASATASPAGGGGGGVSAGGITINITAPQGVTDAMELTEHALTLAFERIALSQGLGQAA